MIATGPVLAGVDLESGTDERLKEADALAARLGQRLVVVHALPEFLRIRMLFPQLQTEDVSSVGALEHEVAEVVTARLAEATGRTADDRIVVVDTGSPHSVIVREAEKAGAGLVVVGPGATAQQVVRYAPCPVLVLRMPSSGPVLATTDFSDPSLPAVAAGVGEAAARQAELVVLHAVTFPDVAAVALPLGVPLPPLPAAARQSAIRGAEQRLEEIVRRFDTRARCVVVDGPALPAILKTASDVGARLIVVGTHGRTGLSRVALGSTAEAVVRDAPCSVLVVRLHAA